MLFTEKDEPVSVDDITTTVAQTINEPLPPINRAQRRAAAKKRGRKKKGHLDDFNEAIKKLNYIDMIEKLRKLNEQRKGEKENEEPSETN